jgi:sugar phosphate isomerase/epimerase
MIERKQFGFMASLDFTRWAPEKTVEALAGAGYGAVEWTLAQFDPRAKSPEELESLVRMTREAELEVSAIAVQQDLLTTDKSLRAQRAKLIEDCIAAAGLCGVKTLNVASGPATWVAGALRIPEEMTEGPAWDLLVNAYSPLIEMAEKHSVILALEPGFQNLCHDYYSTQELFRHLDSPSLGINLDPSHLALYRNDVPWVIRQWAERIKHVHLKDVVGRVGVPGQDFMFPLLGEGLVPWSDFFAALEGIGYKGFLSVEFESFEYYARVLGGDPQEAARLSMAQIERLLAGGAREVFDHGTARGST